MRFDPPPQRLTRELAWVLVRACGPIEAAAPAPGAGDAPFETARRHHLASRIGGRFSPDRLAAEAGAEAGQAFRRLYVATAERAVGLAGLARLVGEAAAAIGEPVVLLKGAALHAAGIVPVGWRAAVDVDVLASRSGAAALHAELQRRGLAPLAIADCEHHLQPLGHTCGRFVEIHPALHGVRIEGDVDAGALLRLARAWPVAGWGGALVPDREVLAAHLLVHGIALHGPRPREYPVMRLAADLVDLYPDAAGWARFRETGAPLVAGDLDDDECAAAEALALTLRAGRVPVGPTWVVDEGAAAFADEVPAAETLLRHLLAGADRDYASSLRISSFLRRPGAGPAPVALLRRAWRTLVLTRAQVDEIYGAQRSALGYWAVRAWRPLDLIVRFVEALLARRRLRRRSG